jgi:hypothetical protein
VTSRVCDFICPVTNIAPTIIKSGNSQISFFISFIAGSVSEKAAAWQAAFGGKSLNGQFHHRMNLPNSVVRHVFATVFAPSLHGLRPTSLSQ